MDGTVKAVDEDCQDAEALDFSVQSRNGATSGGFCTMAGGSRKLATSTAMEIGHSNLIRVGTIGCSGFGDKCSSE